MGRVNRTTIRLALDTAAHVSLAVASLFAGLYMWASDLAIVGPLIVPAGGRGVVGMLAAVHGLMSLALMVRAAHIPAAGRRSSSECTCPYPDPAAADVNPSCQLAARKET